MASGGLLERPGAGTGLLRLPGGVPEAPGGPKKLMLGPRGAPRGEKLIDVGSPGAPRVSPEGSWEASGGGFGPFFWFAGGRGRKS